MVTTDKEMAQKMSKNIYPNVKYLCKKHNKNIKDLEEYLGVSPWYLSRTAPGNKDLGFSKVLMITWYFGISLEKLTCDEIWISDRIKEMEAELKMLKIEHYNEASIMMRVEGDE